ncbi:MAG TPA: hypothetical protein VFW45_12890 [Candidatus Polarisedimenticolia bacterium]|nr:hypothetical protein [Candidatus Polarisedimenticolia bacterium]
MRRVGTILAVLALGAAVCSGNLRADDSVKDSFKKMGKAVGQAGKAVGQEAAQAGRTIGRESKKVWYRGVQVSKPALDRARAETRQAMKRTLDAMDRTIESLEGELRRLREAEAAGGG